MGQRLEEHPAGLRLHYDDIEVDFLNEPLAFGRGKLGRDRDEACACPESAEGVRNVICPVGTLKADTRTRQGIDQRAQLPHETGAFFIKGGIGRFLSIVENGHRVGIGFFKNLLGDIHLKMRLPPCRPPHPWQDMCR